MRRRKNQAALEYLIIIAAVIAVAAIVVLFVTGSFGTQRSKMNIAQCKQAAADCKMNNLISNDPCVSCESACVGSDGRDLMSGVMGCDANGACGLCKQGKATAIYETSCSDLDNDGYAGNATGCSLGTDCNDSNASINPGAIENCSNGVDDDCDGLIDCADSDCSNVCNGELTDGNVTPQTVAVGEVVKYNVTYYSPLYPVDYVKVYIEGPAGLAGDESMTCATSDNKYYLCEFYYSPSSQGDYTYYFFAKNQGSSSDEVYFYCSGSPCEGPIV